MEQRNAVGIIELASIYKGFQVHDEVLKATSVETLVARTICSGKFLLMVRGTVGDVDAAVAVARAAGGFAIVNATSIPNIDPRVFSALGGGTALQVNGNGTVGALLIIETFSVVSAIKAADFAVKEADLELVRVHAAMAVGGKGFVVITGSFDALQAAARRATEYCKEDGMLAGYTIIRNPHEEVLRELL